MVYGKGRRYTVYGENDMINGDRCRQVMSPPPLLRGLVDPFVHHYYRYVQPFLLAPIGVSILLWRAELSLMSRY